MGAAATRSLASWATVSDVARLRAFLGTRDRALVFILLGTGIRLEEATRLRLGDIDLAHECVRVIGKGAKGGGLQRRVQGHPQARSGGTEEVAATIQEAALGIRPEELRKAPMGKVPPYLSKLTTVSSASEPMDELVCFFGLGELVGRPESEAERDKRFREATLWQLKRVIPRRLGIHSKPQPRVEPTPTASFQKQVDDRYDLELWLENLPAAQRQAVELRGEATETGLPLQDVCLRRGRTTTPCPRLSIG